MSLHPPTEPPDDTTTCPHCRGEGFIDDDDMDYVATIECPTCDGYGKVTEAEAKLFYATEPILDDDE